MKKKIIYYILSIVPIIVIDQIIKLFMINKNVIINNFFSIKYTENYGIAFSLLQQKLIIIVISLILIISATIYIIKNIIKLSKIQVISISFVVAGGISNFIDRIFRGYVIDYIDINLFNFPVFNLADIFITFGVILFILKYIFTEK